jgi:hypothetical protein
MGVCGLGSAVAYLCDLVLRRSNAIEAEQEWLLAGRGRSRAQSNGVTWHTNLASSQRNQGRLPCRSFVQSRFLRDFENAGERCVQMQSGMLCMGICKFNVVVV